MKQKWIILALSRWADVIIVAPATANTISKLKQMEILMI
jgi:phosphopantothenoylcysteine synthetase/decarboxylase